MQNANQKRTKAKRLVLGEVLISEATRNIATVIDLTMTNLPSKLELVQSGQHEDSS